MSDIFASHALNSEEYKQRNKFLSDLLKDCDYTSKNLFWSIFWTITSSGVSNNAILTKGIAIASNNALQSIERMRTRLVWSNENILLGMIKQRLLQARSLEFLLFDQSTLTTISHSLLITFLTQAQTNVVEDTMDRSLHVVPIVGIPSNIILLKNQLLMNIPTPSMLSRYSAKDHLTVALFNCSLELPSFDIVVDIDVSESSLSDSTLEVKYLEQFVKVLHDSGVNLVVCQKRVHPYLQRLFHDYNILCLPRVSIRFMSALLRLSGGRQLGSMPLRPSDKIEVTCLGKLKHLRKEYIFGQSFIVAAGLDDSLPKFSTVVICGLSSNITTALEQATNDVLKYLFKLLQDPYVVSCQWKQQVASDLFTFVSTKLPVEGNSARSTSSKVLKVIELFGQSLLDSCDNSNDDAMLSYQDCVTSLKTVVTALMVVLDIEEEICISNEIETTL